MVIASLHEGEDKRQQRVARDCDKGLLNPYKNGKERRVKMTTMIFNPPKEDETYSRYKRIKHFIV